MSSSEKSPERKKSKLDTGHEYEQRAAGFLESIGFAILERNWRAGRKEIDLIARKDNLVVFVEVKASRTRSFGHPSERVDLKKRQNLIAVAQSYIQQKALAGVDFRIDVITFTAGHMDYFPDAFDAE